MEVFRRRESASIDEIDLGIAGEDQVFQLALMECILLNLQKRRWNENQMGESSVGFPSAFSNESQVGMSRWDHVFEIGCE